MTDNYTHEFGRMHMMIHNRTGTVARLLVENVSRDGEHWLTLTSLENTLKTIGYLRLKPVSAGSKEFEIVEVRPATGPLLQLEEVSSEGVTLKEALAAYNQAPMREKTPARSRKT